MADFAEKKAKQLIALMGAMTMNGTTTRGGQTSWVGIRQRRFQVERSGWVRGRCGEDPCLHCIIDELSTVLFCMGKSCPRDCNFLRDG